ncbi:MAG: hypothetical protein AMXMBFR48_13610 [Ignavibacteriales bacterium]
MGYSTIIYITGSVMLFGIMSLNINTVIGDQLTQSVNYYEEVQVRNLCNSVTEMLASSVSSNTAFRVQNYSQLSIFKGSAYYRVVDTVIASDSLVKLEVIGRFGNTPKVTTAYFTVEATEVELPEFMKYAAATGGKLKLSGNSKILDAGDPTLNTDIYVNEVELSHNSLIEGFVNYSSTFTGNVSKVQPNSNPGGLPVTNLVSSAPAVPDFQADSYKAKASVQYSSNLTIGNSTFTLGTKANPTIVYVEGNLYVNANARINGYGVFIVKGNVEMTGNATFGANDPDKSSLGIYAEGNIKTAGNNTYYGQMFAKGNVEMSGNSQVTGNVVAKGNIEMGGNNKIEYRRAASSLTEEIWTGTGGSSTQRAAQRLYYE